MIRIAFIVVFLLCLAIAAAALWLSRQMINTYQPPFHRNYFYYLVNFYVFAFYGIWAQLIMRELLMTEVGQSDVIHQAAALLPVFGVPFLLFSWIALCFSGHSLVKVPKNNMLMGGFAFAFGLVVPLVVFTALTADNFILEQALGNLESVLIAGLLADMAFTMYFGILVIKKARNLPSKKRHVVINFCLLTCGGFLIRALLLPFALSNPWVLAPAILFYFLSGIIPLFYLHRSADLVFVPIFADASSQEKKEKLFAHYGISPREQEIVNKICEGMTNRQIAEELFISVQTVKDHTHRIYSKIGINSRLKLVQMING